MYFRIKKQKNKAGEIREYLCIAESFRKAGKIKQKSIANLGRLDELKQSGNLERLAEKLNQLVGKRILVDLTKDIKSGWSKYYGIIQVLKAVWNRLHISRILLKEEETSRQEYAFHEAISAMVINRLVHPSSKLETWRWKMRVWEPAWDDLNLQHLLPSHGLFGQTQGCD